LNVNKGILITEQILSKHWTEAAAMDARNSIAKDNANNIMCVYTYIYTNT